MAITQGPLFSISAHGAIGKNLIYQDQKGRQIVKKYAVPKNPNSIKQIKARFALPWLAREWSHLSTGEKLTWTERGDIIHIGGYAYFLRENLKRFAMNLNMCAQWPLLTEGPDADVGDPQLYIYQGRLISQFSRGNPPDVFYGLSFASTSIMSAPDYSKLTGIVSGWDRKWGDTEYVIDVSYLPPGTYYGGWLWYNRNGSGTVAVNFWADDSPSDWLG